ncbi:MAG: hypothetical protein GWP27_00465 [Bacteroidetes bacterium]|nr:hypothetical protein [Bacteroidota bacterium]
MVLKTLSLCLIVLLGACSQPKQAEQIGSGSMVAEVVQQPTKVSVAHENYPIRYGVKEGKLMYQYRGLQTGSEEVYFTDYGMVEIKFTSTTRENLFKEEREIINLITLMRDSMIFVVDRSTMNARSIDNSLLYSTALKSPSLDLNEAAEMMYLEKGGQLVRIDTILDLPTRFWNIEALQSKEWRWKGILMKTQVQVGRETMTLEALSIDTISPLPEGIFDLPSDVNIQEGMSVEEWIEALGKPIKKRQYFNFPDSFNRN